MGSDVSVFDVPLTLSLWSAVAIVSFGEPVTSAVSSILPWAPFAAETTTSIG